MAPMEKNRVLSSLVAACLSLALACAPALAQNQRSAGGADQELVRALLDIRRGGCGGAPGTTAAMQWAPALADAAARAAQGEPPLQAARAAGYRATRIFIAALRGYPTHAAVAQAMAQRYCEALVNPALTGIGWHREGNAWWILLATRFDPPELGDAQAIAARVLALSNEARLQPRQCGDRSFQAVGPVRYSATLERAARLHAQDMARHSYLEHVGRDGSSPGDRASRAGYVWQGIGENIAAGQTTAEKVVRDWLRSPAHCSAIMNPLFVEMGVSFAVNPASEAGIYWAQAFGRPR